LSLSIVEFNKNHPDADPVAVEHVNNLIAAGNLICFHFPAPPIRLEPADPIVTKHPTWCDGTHITHVLGQDGTLVECRVRTVPELGKMLDEQGLLCRTPVPELTERSALRTPWKAPKVKLPKVTGRDLNRHHTEYLCGELPLSEYTDKLFHFLVPNHLEDDVYDFLALHSERLEGGTFCRPSDGAFNRVLRKFWNLHKIDHSVETRAPEEKQLLHYCADEPIEASLASPTKANIVKAYQSFVSGEEGATDKLYKLIIKLGTVKAMHMMLNVTEHVGTYADAGQEAAKAVWKRISGFTGSPPEFYAWLSRICTHKGADGYKANVRAAQKAAPLFIQDPDDPGRIVDNPALYREERISVPRKLPEFIQGSDKLICDYIREGLNYQQIGRVLQISETAVQKRVKAMRKKMSG